MLKKILIVVGVLLAAALLAGYLYRDSLAAAAIRAAIGPEQAFAADAAPAAPDYSSSSNWAAQPELEDPSDSLPEGLVPRSGPASVSAFFVHPTTFFGKSSWNQPLDDKAANWITDERVLRHQASVFNSCCDVYAPRYRQATFFSFLDRDGDGGRALDLAYTDVARAFQAFLDAIGPDAPFILAGHSQGSLHGARLLREVIAGTPLTRRLVAAYLIGFSITPDQLGGVPVCASATQTGCALGWNSIEGDGAGTFSGEPFICVNPLTWTADDAYGAHGLNLGGIGFPSWQQTAPEKADPHLAAVMALEPGVADARCQDFSLRVSELRSEQFPSRMSGDALHIYDYSLFHMNIRANAQARVQAYLGLDLGARSTLRGAGTDARRTALR